MPSDGDQPPRSFWSYFLAECRRRWWHALLAIAAVAIGVSAFKPLGISDLVALGAICLSGVAAGLLGGLSLSSGAPSLASRYVDLSRVERRRWFLATMLFSVVACAAATAAAAARAIALLGRYQSVLDWAVENPGLLVAMVGGVSVVALISAHSWAFCTHGWHMSPFVAVSSTGLFCFVWWELPAPEYFPWAGRGFPAAGSVFAGLAVLGWMLAAYGVTVSRPRKRPTKLHRVLPGVVLLAAGLLGFATQGGLAGAYVLRSGLRAEFEDCVPSPDGRHVAVLTAMEYEEEKTQTEAPGSLVPAGLTNPWCTWVMADVRNGSRSRLSGFSAALLTSWSPDGRYFAYWVFETRTSVFLGLLFSRHLDWDWRPETLVTLRCYDTVTGSNKRVASREAYGGPPGWSDASHIRWVNVGFAARSVEAVVNDVDVKTGVKTSRKIEMPWPGGYRLHETRLRRLLVVDREHPSKERTRSTAVHLANLDTGSLMSWPCEMEGRYISASLVSANHAVVWAWDYSDTATQPTTQSAEGGIDVFDSRLIAMQTGRQISLRGSPEPGFNDFWETPDRHWLAERCVYVRRYGLYRNESIGGLLDLETGRSTPLHWPAPHPRRPWGSIEPSPGEEHWLLLRRDKETRKVRVWTLPLDSLHAGFVEHDLTSPADARVSAPHWLSDVPWVNDREIVWISRGRHLVFYDVVERKRTRIVTIK